MSDAAKHLDDVTANMSAEELRGMLFFMVGYIPEGNKKAVIDCAAEAVGKAVGVPC